ncbi:hypothetical protein [Actinomadura gamaensis]|uniref:DUF3293 domain-containing protein n=1 Tax=Actinomadura gamaensis TaxID=1763541 RepID=A0ABV9U8P5_9ACTN
MSAHGRRLLRRLPDGLPGSATRPLAVGTEGSPVDAAREGRRTSHVPAGGGVQETIGVAATSRPFLPPPSPPPPGTFRHPTPALAALQTAPLAPGPRRAPFPAATTPAVELGGTPGQGELCPAAGDVSAALGLIFRNDEWAVRRIGALFDRFRARATWSGPSDDAELEALVAGELVRLRREHSCWAIIYNPFACAWVAFRSRGDMVLVAAACTPQQLDAALRPSLLPAVPTGRPA